MRSLSRSFRTRRRAAAAGLGLLAAVGLHATSATTLRAQDDILVARSQSEPTQPSDMLRRLRDGSATPLAIEDATALWYRLADVEQAGTLSVDIVAALIGASLSPQAREAMWNALAGLAKARPGTTFELDRALLTLFERHRDTLLPLLAGAPETESSGNAMVDLMTATRIFGPDLDASVAWLAASNPAAMARRIERARERGRSVSWEAAAFAEMLRWKSRVLAADAPDRPRTLADLDAAGETFAVVFNSLHGHPDSHRRQMLAGLAPENVFDIVVGGELELYRLGTSAYRDFMHDIIVRGLTEARSFEAFLTRTAAGRLGEEANRQSGRRAMVYLRVASSFGLLEPVLATVADQATFIDAAVDSLGDPRHFESNASVLMDILTGRSTASAAITFRRALLDRLYDRYRSETNETNRKIFGSLLAVYQSLSGERRLPEIDRAFPLDGVMLRIPFADLFDRDGRGKLVHRMFMRFDDDGDASSTHRGFRTRMRVLGAIVQAEPHFDVFRLHRGERTIEIYANRPTSKGTRDGIADLAKALHGVRVHTVVGRGHTGIIAPLQADSRKVLGSRIRDVAAVIVGACGGSASVRDLITTFGYLPFVSTRATGRMVLNSAIIDGYVAQLTSMRAGDHLAMTDVVAKATAPFLRPGADAELRDDAGFYQVNAASVLSAVLFDRHVRELVVPERRPVAEPPPRPERPRIARASAAVNDRKAEIPQLLCTGGGGLPRPCNEVPHADR